MFSRRTAPWLLAGIMLTGMCLFVNLVGQSLYRHAVESRQVVLAEEISFAFEKNQFTEETLRSSFDVFRPSVTPIVDIQLSVSPWLQIYDGDGNILASSAVLEGVGTPKIPTSVLEWVQKNGEDRLSWEPKKGVRQAVVVTKFSGLKEGYVVVGKSLRETEKWILQLHLLTGGVWIGFMILLIGTWMWSFGYHIPLFQKKTLRG